MRHVTPEEEHHVMQALADVAPSFKAMRDERDEYQRRIELAVSMIDRLSQFAGWREVLEESQLRAVLDEGARPDLEPDEEGFANLEGTMRRGMREFTGGKP